MQNIAKSDASQRKQVEESKSETTVRSIVNDLQATAKAVGPYQVPKNMRDLVEKRVVEGIRRLRVGKDDLEPVTHEEVRNMYRIALLAVERDGSGLLYDSTGIMAEPEFARSRNFEGRIVLDTSGGDGEKNTILLREIGEPFGLTGIAETRLAIESLSNDMTGRYSRDALMAAYVRASAFGKNLDDSRTGKAGVVQAVSDVVRYMKSEKARDPSKVFDRETVNALYQRAAKGRLSAGTQ